MHIPHHSEQGKSYPLRLIAWEVTRSCNLACKHCRAEAHLEAYPGELTTDEAKELIRTFPQTGQPIVIFTGGEPLLRQDLFELVAMTRSMGLKPVLAPNGTLITPAKAKEMVKAGIERVSISLDGHNAQTHNLFRGVDGAFEAALQGISYLKEEKIPFQINTTVTKDNLANFKEIFTLSEKLGAVAWHIFLLVPTGRGAMIKDQVISAQEYEQTLHWFYGFRKTTKMHLKATCAPHYHRIFRERARAEGIKVDFKNFGLDAVSRGCLGGIGFCFISHTGQVQPCGYLELDCGQIRREPFPKIWHKSKIFSQLRNPSLYQGKCGYCEYHKVCGGCRARALTINGHFLAEEPFCLYQPKRSPSLS